MSIYTCRSTTCPMAVVHLSESNAAEMGGVCPRCGGYLRPTEILASTSLPPAQDDSLKSLILERFPFPIAYGYRQIVEAPEARHAVDSAFYTYTALLRLPTLILLGQFLQGGSQNPHAAKAVQLLRTPTLESWFTALTKLAKHLFPLLPGKTVAFAPWERGGPFSPGLAAAARSFKGLKRDGHYVHERLRNLRNARAHGAIWNESDFANILPEIRALLHDALEHFSPLAELELLRKSPQGMIRLVGAQDLFEEVGIPDARLEDLFETSETALRDPDGNFLALYPLFLGEPEPFPGGYIEPLLCFDGHGQKAAVFLGTRNRVENQKVLTRYLDLLRAKDIDPRFTKEEFAPWSVAQWAREASLGTVDNLKGVKYFPDFYRERNQASKGVVIQEGADASEAAHEETCGVDDAFSRWLEMGRQAALIIASEAGAGKTSLFCRMAESLLGPSRPDGAEGDGGTECVLLVLGEHLRGRTTLFDRIREGLGFSDDLTKGGIGRFDELLDAWLAVGQKKDMDHSERSLVLLVDAANEGERPKELFEELSQLAAQAATANRRAAEDGDRRGRAFVRLAVSVRAERIETLVERWNDRHDTPFLSSPENFAHFKDRQGKERPYLSLRAFSSKEAEEAYRRVQEVLGAGSCPASWDRLAGETRELMRHPLMLRLFHEAFAGNAQPVILGADDAVWGAWLGKTFAAGERLEGFALDLADACIDGGHSAIPADLVGEWRAAWQAGLDNDPIRIASELDPLERLAEGGLLREGEGGGLDWVSDSLAEQVIFRALQRRDEKFSEESLAMWLGLPARPRLDKALIRVGERVWSQGRALAVRLFLTGSHPEGTRLLGVVLANVAPRGPEGGTASELEVFRRTIETLGGWCLEGGNLDQAERWKRSLLRETYPMLQRRWGAVPAMKVAMSACIEVAEWLDSQKHENKDYLRDLSISYTRMGTLEGRSDPGEARVWLKKSLEIKERLAAQEPENKVYQWSLSISYMELGWLDDYGLSGKARAWFEKALQIRERLVAQEPKDSDYLMGLSGSYESLGDHLNQIVDSRGRIQHEKALEIRRRLAALKPEDTGYMGDLAVSYERLGDLDKRTDPAKARVWFEKALEIRKRLVILEPEWTLLAQHLSVSLLQLGDLDVRSDPAKARIRFGEALEIWGRLVALESENRIYMLGLSHCFVRLGDA